MIRTTPFHERTGTLNESGLWSHWSGYLAAEKYSLSEKFEYFAVRNAAAIFDTSPLFKYRFTGRDAERFLAGVLARDPRALAPGHAQYTIWCDDRGFLVEDGVLLRHAADDFVLTSAEPNFAYFADLIGRSEEVTIADESEDWAVLSLQGPRSRGLLAGLDKAVDRLAYFEHTEAKIGGRKVIVSRTGFTGDLGYEVWARAEDGLAVWDAVWAATRGNGVLPFGLQALYMTRIEAGLLLLDVDFANSRFAWTDADRATPHELGLGWMLRGTDADERRFIGRDAIRREVTDKTSRFRTTGLVIDWRDWDRIHDEAGLIPPKDHTPIQEEMFVYDDDGAQVGYATSFMYSPVLQRHIAIARVPVAAAASPGT
ncbi:MAG: aminomethyltransferase family protein, partial [Candidatus Limnocylindrales bacterium]